MGCWVLGDGGHRGCSGDTGLRKGWESCKHVLGLFLSPLRPGGLSNVLAVAGGSQAIGTVLGGGGGRGRTCWDA